MSQVSLITISLKPPYPESGMAATVVRLRGQDKHKLDVAADHMGMTRSFLMRLLLVKGAERILRELGVELVYEQNDNVDLSKGEVLVSEKTRD
jgi:hypothetical protein